MPIATEHQEAVLLADYLRVRGVVFVHVPNERILSGLPDSFIFGAIAKQKAEGLQKGFPDYLILSGPQGKRVSHLPGIAIELKRVGEVPNDAQMGWLRELDRLGWHACWAAGADDAIRQLEEAWT